MPIPQTTPRSPLAVPPADHVFSGLFRESPLPMLLVDVRSRRITGMNRAAARFLGYEAEALEGRPLGDLDSGTTAEIEEHLLLALACGDHEPRLRRWRTGRGEVVAVEVVATRLHSDQGTQLVLYVHEQPEENIHGERSPADEALIRQHEAMGRLASGFAREFGEIVDRIERTALDLEQESSRNRRVASGLAELLDSGRRARQLIRELLTFAGQRNGSGRVVSLNEVVADSEEEVRAQLPQDVGLLVNLCSGSTTVDADPGELATILPWLVLHAREALPQGGYVVLATDEVELDESDVEAHPTLRPGLHVVLSVTGTGGAGRGGSEDLEAPSSPGVHRSGVHGPDPISVHEVVQRSGGIVTVVSRPDVGTTFRVVLPRVSE